VDFHEGRKHLPIVASFSMIAMVAVDDVDPLTRII